MSRTVFCEYSQRDTEGLDFAPLPGDLGQRVFDHIGKEAWSKWLAHQTMLINEWRLSPRKSEDRKRLEAELQKFLFEGGGSQVAGYVPEDG